jgi:feruloyl esterase
MKPLPACRSLMALLMLSACAVPTARHPAQAPPIAGTAPMAPDRFAQACAALSAARWPDPSTRIVRAAPQNATASTPYHCEVQGVIGARVGVDGQAYKIGFHLRLPSDWNGRFFFQGGSGSNGELGDAMGRVAASAPTALSQGYAVLSQDSGHDNAANTRPAQGGPVAFGFDPQARADYGHASLLAATTAAKAAIVSLYGRAPRYSYFVGCSKGGQEGMALAQRYPTAFDGIIAAAPGFSLPRAAVAEAWDTQAFMSLIPGQATPSALAQTFSDADLRLVADATLAACDGDDGLVDGLIGAFARCTAAKVAPELQRRTCAGDKTQACLSPDQVAVLKRSFAGPRDSAGKALYADWAWDAGVAAPGWRLWKIGGVEARPPALNVLLGMPSLAAVFSTPPRGLADPSAALAFAKEFDADRQGAAIYATSDRFPRSAWDDIAARSPNLDAFRAHGGKLIVPHGVSDPVFSINDTLAWYGEVQARTGGKAASFARVFPVPGMNHCMGGPATDEFNAFQSLVAWVEDGQAPDAIIAKAGPTTPWPNRTRPLCAFPKIARYDGHGDINLATSFQCKA